MALILLKYILTERLFTKLVAPPFIQDLMSKSNYLRILFKTVRNVILKEKVLKLNLKNIGFEKFKLFIHFTASEDSLYDFF